MECREVMTKQIKMSSLIIHMAGEDREIGWGMLTILIATGPPEEAPKLPEGEDIKEAVWTQLGRMEGHKNVVSPTLIHLYTPVKVAEETGDLEEDEKGSLGQSCPTSPWYQTSLTTDGPRIPPQGEQPGGPRR